MTLHPGGIMVSDESPDMGLEGVLSNCNLYVGTQCGGDVFTEAK